MPSDQTTIATPAFAPPAGAWTPPQRHQPSPLEPETPPATPATPDESAYQPRHRDRRTDPPPSRDPAEPTPTDTSLEDGATATDRPPAEIKVTRQMVAQAAGAVVGALLLGAAVAVRMRYRGERRLRQPKPAHVDAFAEPATRILMRRAGMARWGIDLIDGLSALGAVGLYLNDGPVTIPVVPQAVMPEQETDE